MKTLLLLAAVCASVVSVSASTVDITEMNVSYSPPSSIGWSVQAPQLSRPFDNLHDFDGAGIVSGLSITCSAPLRGGFARYHCLTSIGSDHGQRFLQQHCI